MQPNASVFVNALGIRLVCGSELGAVGLQVEKRGPVDARFSAAESCPDLAKAMDGSGVSRSKVSRLCGEKKFDERKILVD